MTPTRTSSRLARVLACLALGAAVATTPALAQEGGSKKKEVQLSPPVPPLGKSDTPWLPYGAAILLALLVVGVNFIPSKRGHQD